MYKLPFFFFTALSFFASGQTLVDTYYSSLNSVVKDFVLKKDTVAYYKNILKLCKHSGKEFSDLTASSKLFKEVYFTLGKSKTEKLLECLTKNSIYFDSYLKRVIKESKSGNDIGYLKNLDLDHILKKNRRHYKTLYERFEHNGCIDANNFYWPDQLGRSIASEFNCVNNSGSREIISFTDSLNLINLFYLIEEQGFPTSEVNASFGYFILFFHTFARPCNYNFSFPNGVDAISYLDSVLLIEVFKGKFRNREYAYLKDLQLSHSGCGGTAQLYGSFFVERRDNFPIFDIKNIDMRRADIYLPPLWVDALLYGFALPIGYDIPEEVKQFF